MNTSLLPDALQVTGADAAGVDADWLAVPIFESDDVRAWPAGGSLGPEVARALTRGGLDGTRYELLKAVPSGGALRARRLLLVGAGPGAEYTTEIARRLAAASVIEARRHRVGRLAFVHRVPADPGDRESLPEWIRAEAEGLTLGEFDPGRYKTGADDHRSNPGLVLVVTGAGQDLSEELRAAADRGRQVAHCTNLARELVNEPGNLLSPRVLAERASELIAGTGLTLDVLDEHRLAALGMRLMLGVGQGSHEPPRLIAVSHNPAAAPERPVLALVGKGVTFDAGGISIKSADGMERMKDDMAGGAAVLLAMRAIALLKPSVRVVGIVAAVENMPGGGATRPGDVLRGASGRTVEVVNTDAEGRLILGDALWYARSLGATHLVDIATLTGACMVALGRSISGVFGRPEAWRDRVRGAADRCGERTWPLPLPDDYRELLKSEIADTVNSGERYGAAVTAALFVGEFAGALPWAHVDIAGPAWNEEAKPFLPKGPTGAGVRTLVELACGFSA